MYLTWFIMNHYNIVCLIFKGLKFLLENHLSHLFLKTLLVNLQDLIHDNSEKVRAAFVDLLLLVKGMKAIKVRFCYLTHVATVSDVCAIFESSHCIHKGGDLAMIKQVNNCPKE